VSPGEDALREAARLETARIYSQILAPGSAEAALADDEDDTGSVTAAIDEYALTTALWRLDDDEAATRRAVAAAIRAGKPNSAIVADWAVTYSEVRAIRKQLMRGAA
jgi:hypothetical protein